MQNKKNSLVVQDITQLVNVPFDSRQMLQSQVNTDRIICNDQSYYPIWPALLNVQRPCKPIVSQYDPPWN